MSTSVERTQVIETVLSSNLKVGVPRKLDEAECCDECGYPFKPEDHVHVLAWSHAVICCACWIVDENNPMALCATWLIDGSPEPPTNVQPPI